MWGLRAKKEKKNTDHSVFVCAVCVCFSCCLCDKISRGNEKTDRQTDSYVVRSRLMLSGRRNAVCFFMWGLRKYVKKRRKKNTDRSACVRDASPVRRKAIY